MKRLIQLQTNRQKTNTDQLKILHVMCKMVITNLVFATAMFFRLDLKASPFYTNNDVSLLSFTCSQLMLSSISYSPYSEATCKTVLPRSSLENTVTAEGSWRFLNKT